MIQQRYPTKRPATLPYFVVRYRPEIDGFSVCAVYHRKDIEGGVHVTRETMTLSRGDWVWLSAAFPPGLADRATQITKRAIAHPEQPWELHCNEEDDGYRRTH